MAWQRPLLRQCQQLSRPQRRQQVKQGADSWTHNSWRRAHLMVVRRLLLMGAAGTYQPRPQALQLHDYVSLGGPWHLPAQVAALHVGGTWC
jgi:hypothetical protein